MNFEFSYVLYLEFLLLDFFNLELHRKNNNLLAVKYDHQGWNLFEKNYITWNKYLVQKLIQVKNVLE